MFFWLSYAVPKTTGFTPIHPPKPALQPTNNFQQLFLIVISFLHKPFSVLPTHLTTDHKILMQNLTFDHSP
jgi:hypothetical protein